MKVHISSLNCPTHHKIKHKYINKSNSYYSNNTMTNHSCPILYILLKQKYV